MIRIERDKPMLPDYRCVVSAEIVDGNDPILDVIAKEINEPKDNLVLNVTNNRSYVYVK